jgi:tripartite-type tricarboxylate transporter receptor subunit TctC
MEKRSMHLGLVRLARAAAAALFMLAAGSATAQEYPSKPVRIIVPFPPGGTVDLVARVLAQGLTDQTGQQFVVENRSGASGSIGSDAVAKAAPDGYTLLVQAPTLIVSPLISKKVPYDAIRDFKPVALLGSVPMVLTINPSIPAANYQEFAALVRAQPDKYAFGTSAVGSPMHLANEAIKRDGRLEIPIVIYRGTAGALNDLLGGQISGMIDAIPSSAPHIASGKLKPIAVTTRARVPALPNVPTIAESGIAEFDMGSWYGLWGPAGLPEPIAAKLQALAAKAMTSKLANERLAAQNFVPETNVNGDAFAQYIARQLAVYARIVKDANITAD